MSKRRRTSSIASRSQEDDSLDSLEASTCTPTTTTMRKRLKKQDPMELCQQLYEIIRNHKKEDGTLLCDAFIRVPKRRQEPAYYEVVNNPIDLLKVQQKLKTDEYEDMEELQNDIELMVSNAKAFYKKSSQEYRDACDLWDLFLANKNRMLDGKDDDDHKGKIILKVGKLATKRAAAHHHHDTPTTSRRHDDQSEDTSESSTNQDDETTNIYEDLFTAVMTATDSENRPLHAEFQLVPSRKRYPEYFEIIETPIDLKMIAQKIQNNEYSSLSDMEKDLLLMTKNACLFNEPGSQIYRSAKLLKKIITSKKIEIEHGRYPAGGKSSERIRNKRLRGNTSLSAVTAALRNEDSDTEMEADESIEDDGADFSDSENPQWQLFDAIQSTTNNAGIALSEPFMRLPSKRFYPGYYKEIKNPISLTQIRKKMQNRAYGTVSEVAGDMNIMFENAKKYNVATSKLYKDAVKLQKIMQDKVTELLDVKDQDTDSDLESEDLKIVQKKKGPRPKTYQGFGTPQRGRPPKDQMPLKKKMHHLAKSLLDYCCEDGRKPSLAFMEKPSKKLYPDYYEVITEPIDFLEIESRIKADYYANEEELIRDFKLMFNNCRQYNEENSTLYEDANLLERRLLEKVGLAMPTPEKKLATRAPRLRKHMSQLERHCKQLFDAVRDYKEPKANRQLSQIFLKLPTKGDYPEYYEVIKNPIDMEKISHKLRNNIYETIDELVADFVLMFDNACKFNEPDSQIYKDALVLQRICLQTKQQLKEDDETSVPDVAAAVQDILLNLFTTFYNHQDADERCYSDSMAELPEHDDVDGKKIRALSLDLIKRRLDKGLYKRLDTFQEDVFACLERARRLSRSDSQTFDDSVELQMFFIKQRDELCKNGETLQSPALNYTLTHLKTAVESQRQSKILQESLEDENETRSSDDSAIIKDPHAAQTAGDTLICNQQTYKVGEFVYLDAKEKGCEPHILLIERLWTQDGEPMLHGNYYLRPAETFHHTNKKFLEREVFKSDTHVDVPLEEVKDRCCVMNIKHYFTMKPEGYDEKDVYVCESRYNTRARAFKKIKIFPENPSLVLVPRESPLEPKRIMSVFRERVEKHKDELAELQEQEKLVEKEKPNVVLFNNLDMDNGCTFYEQYNTVCSGLVKTGDFVYVVAKGGKQAVAQIHSIWDTKDGKCYFKGPWFMSPNEVPQTSIRMFFKQELFMSTLSDKNPLVSIVGKCCVLDYHDYIACRPTEIPETDVYICASVFDELTRQIQRIPAEGLKRFNHSNAVTEDEVYYFPKLITPTKVGSDVIQQSETQKATATNTTIMEVLMPISQQDASPVLTKINDMDILMEDSLDGGPPSVGSGEIPAIAASVPGNTTTPATARKRAIKNKLVTGYILYSRDVRKQVVQNNPESNFGEISKIVGNEWRSLPAHEKLVWEEKATKMNEESKALLLDEQCASPVHPDQIYECLWDNCDYQFEEIQDCIEHCIKDNREGQGHVQSYFQKTNPDSEMNCQWRNCLRNNKKNVQPFPNIARLIRHVRDMHINKGNGRIVAPENRSKNFKASTKVQARPTPTATPTPSVPSLTVTAPQKQAEPMFISVPPRPQRVLHSEAYIKYIEGLQVESKHIGNWERTLNATQETTPPPDLEKLSAVATWLGKGVNQQENVLSALWMLRNQLLKDTLGLHKTL